MSRCACPNANSNVGRESGTNIENRNLKHGVPSRGRPEVFVSFVVAVTFVVLRAQPRQQAQRILTVDGAQLACRKSAVVEKPLGDDRR